MPTERVFEQQTIAKSYPIRYSIWDYQFPTADAIAAVHFDDKYIHIELTDERLLSIPLCWIPPLRDASPEEREKYEISDDRTLLIWDPAISAINEILRLADYLHARPHVKSDYPTSGDSK